MMPGAGSASIVGFLDHGPDADDRIAIDAPGRLPFIYGKLREHVINTVETLNRLGFSRNDRIALALPNGPELAVADLSVASGFTCVPLNPDLRQPEFEQCLAGARARALISLSGESMHAAAAARSLGVQVIELIPSDRVAGLFELHGEICPAIGPVGLADGEDIAFLLQTSGTTSRSKFIPLTHNNIYYTESCMVRAFRMNADDRCLNVAPLFFTQAILGSLLLSMASGGSVVCVPGLSDTDFLRWMADYKPTWYLGSPAIHRKVLESVEKCGRPVPRTLRFIRSATFPLSPSLMARLEEAFGTCVLEVYGLTETGPVTSNPLPPLTRKPGSVGITVCGEVAIRDSSGHISLDQEPGEIVVRGPNVMKGYDDNPAANAETFVDGWLRTGDIGYFDPDGYLYITGRIKEFINRGGIKVSPYEVEEALGSHPAVLECAVFPMPDPAFGEAVGAAVILRAGTDVKDTDLRAHVLDRLSYYKVPVRIFFVDELPKTPTGKVQRNRIIEWPGIAAERTAQPAPMMDTPITRTEAELVRIWAEVFHRENIGALDNFLELGGDSLLATQIMSRIRETFNADIPIASVIIAENLAALAAEIERSVSRTGTGGA